MEAAPSKPRKLKLVVSDFHLGSGLYLKDGTRNILEDFQYDDAFISFLNYHGSGEYFDAEIELVINGDFMNLLQINYKGVHTHLITERIVLEGLRQSVNGHAELFRALRRFAAAPNHSVVYVIGNHDQGMLFGQVRKYFVEVLNHEVRFYDSHYEFDGIRIEHGHMHEWSSRFDSRRYFVSRGLPEPVLNLPWGSRFVAEFLPKIKMERPYVDKVKPFRHLLRWMFVNDTFFAFKAGLRVIWYFIKSLVLQRLGRHFTWRGTLDLIKSITIYPDFDREARKIMMLNPEIHTLIMGHTHVLHYRRYPEGREYYNIGTWNEATNLSIANLGTMVALSYARIEFPELPADVDPTTAHDKASLRPKVKLKEWKGVWRPEVDAAI
ncbi:MAG: hypothetical protein HYW49_10700 [Deltaproteobacteria bacterium]|nr:hypothetical protein [Deltaproteobacteria bacterium]